MQKRMFDEFQHSFMTKRFRKSKNRGDILSLIKSIYKDSIVNVIFHGERQCFTPKVRNKARISAVTAITKHSARRHSARRHSDRRQEMK